MTKIQTMKHSTINHHKSQSSPRIRVPHPRFDPLLADLDALFDLDDGGLFDLEEDAFGLPTVFTFGGVPVPAVVVVVVVVTVVVALVAVGSSALSTFLSSPLLGH